jgi:hypothetical protein
LIKLADLYLKPETLKSKYQKPKQPNSQQPRLYGNIKSGGGLYPPVLFETEKNRG